MQAKVRCYPSAQLPLQDASARQGFVAKSLDTFLGLEMHSSSFARTLYRKTWYLTPRHEQRMAM